MGREKLARIVALHDHGVAQRDGVVLPCAADVRDAAGGHDLEPDETEGLTLRVRENAVGRLVHRPERALRDEVIEEQDVRVARGDSLGEIARRCLGRERDPFHRQIPRADASADRIGVRAAAAPHEKARARSGVAHRRDRVDGPEPALVRVEASDLHERGALPESRAQRGGLGRRHGLQPPLGDAVR